MKITNKTSKPAGIFYYGKGIVIEPGESFEISSERIGDSITVQSELGEVSLYRGFDERIVAETGKLRASQGELSMDVIIHE